MMYIRFYIYLNIPSAKKTTSTKFYLFCLVDKKLIFGSDRKSRVAGDRAFPELELHHQVELVIHAVTSV